jgi:hypothetical protein
VITGAVNARLEATIRLVVHDATGQPHDVEVVVDTAYNGFLTLPAALRTALGLPLGNSQQVRFADGSIQVINVYEPRSSGTASHARSMWTRSTPRRWSGPPFCKGTNCVSSSWLADR